MASPTGSSAYSLSAGGPIVDPRMGAIVLTPVVAHPVPLRSLVMPAASVAGFYLAHPEAHYFAVGKIGRDQLQDWAQRSGMPIGEAEKWLAPLL